MNQKGFAPILILVGILIITLIAAGAYYLGKTQITPKSQQPVAILQTPQPSPTPDETINWKTYTNDELKFTFHYPNDYYYEGEDEETVAFSSTFMPGHQIISSALIIYFSQKTNTLSLKKCGDLDFKSLKDNETYQCLDTDIENKTINGIKMRFISLIYGQKNSQSINDYIVQTVNEPKIEFVHHVLGGGVATIMDQILSTFTFLELPDTCTSDSDCPEGFLCLTKRPLMGVTDLPGSLEKPGKCWNHNLNCPAGVICG